MINPMYHFYRHILNFRVFIHKRIGSKTKVYGFYFSCQFWQFFVQEIQGVSHKARFNPFGIRFHVSKPLGHIEGIAREITPMGTPQHMVRSVISIFDSGFVEKCFPDYGVHGLHPHKQKESIVSNGVYARQFCSQGQSLFSRGSPS